MTDSPKSTKSERIWGMLDGPVEVNVPHTDASDDADKPASDEAAPTPDSSSESSTTLAGPRRMSTVLSDFRPAFDAALAPLSGPAHQAANALADSAPDSAARQALPAIRETNHQIDALLAKVDQQQAYVLIFGPLKSGKSTFMNSMSAAYVSEVTALPAYPCMVYVMHAKEPTFVVHRYNGSTETLHDRDALHATVEAAHVELTAQLREVERAGRTFEPAVDLPSAIRRIDVKLPAGDLEASSAALVDTPGLYSRMKFGYDHMTRDFRDAAACAIFVVKTDNLFLEQVFDEFNELLELFSRIFLVVNIDSTKKDLQPDGTLAPSLEGNDPAKVIEAFEDLSMTAPLKAAADEGKLRIYPVDLLQAASRRILESRGKADEAEAHTTIGLSNFGALRQDLTDYLNSSEYLHAFVRDSTRRALRLTQDLMRELKDNAAGPARADVDQRKQESAAAEAVRDAVLALRDTPWRNEFVSLKQAMQANVDKNLTKVREAANADLRQAINNWMTSDASLLELVQGSLTELFGRVHDHMVQVTFNELRAGIPTTSDRLPVSKPVLANLTRMQFDVPTLAHACAKSFEPSVPRELPDQVVKAADVPVKKTFWDWLLLRTAAKVNQRLVGPPSSPDKPISAAVKAKRLGEPAADAIEAVAQDALTAVLDSLAGNVAGTLYDQYMASLTQAITKEIKARQATAEQTYAESCRKLEQAKAVAVAVESATAASATATQALEHLQTDFARPEPEPDSADDDASPAPVTASDNAAPESPDDDIQA